MTSEHLVSSPFLQETTAGKGHARGGQALQAASLYCITFHASNAPSLHHCITCKFATPCRSVIIVSFNVTVTQHSGSLLAVVT